MSKSLILRIFDCPAEAIPDVMDRVGAEYDVDDWHEKDDHVFVEVGEASDSSVQEDHFRSLSKAIDEEAGAHCVLRVEVREGDRTVAEHEYASDAWEEVALAGAEDIYKEHEESEDTDSW